MQMEQQRLAEEQPNVGALLTKRSDDYFTQTARVADEGISTPKVQQLAKDTGQDIRTVLRDVKASDDVLKALEEANITQLPKTFDEAIDVLENTPSLRRILDACL
jgi:histone H3/H4